MGGLDKGA